MDFTIKQYIKLLRCFQDAGYVFLTFEAFMRNSDNNKVIVLRHDVDKLPHNSLIFAEIQNKLNIKGSYYFRTVSQSWDVDIIRKIADLGHEIGYHYESLTVCKGNIEAAYIDFCDNLTKLRKIVKVQTICMHGSPASIYDSKDIWKKYDYKNLGIIGEPYFDIDFSKCFYLTDTGRRWNGWRYSIRDKIKQQNDWIKSGYVYKNTYDIIKAVEMQKMPEKIMITFHPQRWTDNYYLWIQEFILQNIKNFIKKLILIVTKN